MFKKRTIITGLILLLAIGVLASLGWAELKRAEKKGEELTLKDFPKLFKEKVIIVIGKNASQIEVESAKQIAAKLKKLTKTQPIIKKDDEVLKKDKIDNNLILLGTPTTNTLLEEVYNLTNATRVTAEYPGKNKGIIEVLRNPWNSNKTLLIVAGSDEWGMKAGNENLVNSQELEEKKSIIVDFATTYIIIGAVTTEVIDPVERKTNSIQIKKSAVFYSCHNMNYLAGVNISPFELIENGKTTKTGISLPVFNVDIMVIDNIPAVTGETIGSFREYSFYIGKDNYFPIEKSIDSSKTIAVKVWFDGKQRSTQNEYYLKIRAKKSGDCPVSVTIFHPPLYDYAWMHNMFYDADISFMPSSNSYELNRDEEFLERILEMRYVGWRFFRIEKDDKGEVVWNPPFERLLQIELNLTSEQLEKLREFLSKKIEIMREEVPEIRKILNGKDEQLLEWVEKIIDFYGYLGLASTPKPKSTEQLNSIKEEFFKSEWYQKRLEKKTSEFLLSMKNLNLTSSQEVKIKNLVKDSIKKIDDLKAQLCAVQYGYYIEKTKKITQSSLEFAKEEKEKSIVENIVNLIKLRNEQIKKILTKEQILKFEEEFWQR